MASANLDYSGHTSVLNARASCYEEGSTSGSERLVRLKVYVWAKDYTGARQGKYSVSCGETGTDISDEPCSISGDEFKIFDETFTVYLDDYDDTAYIDFSFDAQIYSSSAGAWRKISGTVDSLHLTQYIPPKPVYTLHLNKGSGSTITVERTSSTEGGTGILSAGANLWEGDKLRITFGANTGYNLTKHTVNGSNFTSGNTYTVNGNVTVVSAAEVKAYSLSINAGGGSKITVNRTSSPRKGASTGNLGNGATIYYADVLKITFAADAGHELKTHTVNGSTFTSGNSHTVSGNVSVVAATNMLGLVYISNGTSLEAYLIYIDNGSGWVQYVPYVDNGSGWDVCS